MLSHMGMSSNKSKEKNRIVSPFSVVEKVQKSSKKLIAPSILSANFTRLEDEIQKITMAGADWIHVDVMDGQFVRNITIGMPVVASLNKIAKIPLDVHLMIDRPERYIDEFINAGADVLTIHVESTSEALECIHRIRERGVSPGITLRPGTSLESVIPYLEKVDLVLVMTVDPGFGGQKFMMDQVKKMEELKKIRSEISNKFVIEVDGGVNAETFQFCEAADVLVAGSYVFSNDYKKAIDSIR